MLQWLALMMKASDEINMSRKTKDAMEQCGPCSVMERASRCYRSRKLGAYGYFQCVKAVKTYANCVFMVTNYVN
jgi:hypothetical protein